MTDVQALNAASEDSRAQLRSIMADPAGALVSALDVSYDAERRWAQDPDREDLADQARTARDQLDEARGAFDRKLTAEKGNHTKRVNAALAALK